MHAFLRASFVFLVCTVSALAAENTVRVAASRELRLAIVDPAKATPASDAVHQAFAHALGEAISARSGGPLGVRAKRVPADQAAFSLQAGVYDAVLVFGATVPRPLAISGVARLSAILGSGKEARTLYFIFGGEDAVLSELLTVSYPAALNSDKFLAALKGANAPLVASRGN
jgi:hypothetical protein